MIEKCFTKCGSAVFIDIQKPFGPAVMEQDASGLVHQQDAFFIIVQKCLDISVQFPALL